MLGCVQLEVDVLVQLLGIDVFVQLLGVDVFVPLFGEDSLDGTLLGCVDPDDVVPFPLLGGDPEPGAWPLIVQPGA